MSAAVSKSPNERPLRFRAAASVASREAVASVSGRMRPAISSAETAAACEPRPVRRAEHGGRGVADQDVHGDARRDAARRDPHPPARPCPRARQRPARVETSRSASTARMMIVPIADPCQNGDTPMRLSPLRIITMMMTPISVPITEPRPP